MLLECASLSFAYFNIDLISQMYPHNDKLMLLLAQLKLALNLDFTSFPGVPPNGKKL
jgi:hypothetical protein